MPPIIMIRLTEYLSKSLPRKIEPTAEPINHNDRAPESWD